MTIQFTIPTHPTFTIYAEDKGRAARPVSAALPADVASAALKQAAKDWTGSKNGRTAKIDGLFLTMRYSDKKLAHVLFADPVENPKGDEPGQPKRKGGAK